LTATLNPAAATEITVSLTISSLSTTVGSDHPAKIPPMVVHPRLAALTLTVPLTNDAIAEGDESVVLQLNPVLGADLADPFSATLIIQDDDRAAINLSSPSSFITSEAGGAVTFTIILNSRPTAPVTLTVISTDPTEGLPAPSQLHIEPYSWDIGRRVTVTGQDDVVVDGDIPYHIVVTQVVSPDPYYHDLYPDALLLTNQDDDPPRYSHYLPLITRG
jgi:hypothetical protein